MQSIIAIQTADEQQEQLWEILILYFLQLRLVVFERAKLPSGVDLVLLDVSSVPTTVIRELRTRFPALPILAYGERDSLKSRVLAAGATMFIKAPALTRDLERAIWSALEADVEARVG